MRVLAIDTETTGLSPDDDRLIELGLVLHDDAAGGGGLDLGCAELGHADVIVNPGRPLPAEVARLTGLTSSALQAGVDEGAALELLAFWMARCDVVIAWNAPFDRAMIAAAAARTTTTLPARPRRGAMDVARHAHPEWPRHRLQDAVLALGLEVTPTHRALDDARAALAVWRRLVPAAPPTAPSTTTTTTTTTTTRARIVEAPPAPLGWRRLFA
jgi:DNA polymerase-3 subunit epsilon